MSSSMKITVHRDLANGSWKPFTAILTCKVYAVGHLPRATRMNSIVNSDGRHSPTPPAGWKYFSLLWAKGAINASTHSQAGTRKVPASPASVDLLRGNSSCG